VLQQANKAVDQDLLDEALEDLVSRVDDWKNHKVEQFGRLLIHGVYTVVTGKSDQEKDVGSQATKLRGRGADVWVQYEIYLFECILLCCKELQPNKSKDKKDKTKSTGPKIRNRSAKLQLKGRIFMTNVTEVVSLSKPGMAR
jgi:cell division control protein 24